MSERRAPVLPRELKETLESLGCSPRHRFGQNFMARAEVLDAIVELAELEPNERVLEVGPGLGGLSERILCAGARLVSVEIDHGYIDFLNGLFGEEEGFRLIAGDILHRKSRLAPEVVEAFAGEEGPVSVVSNLPYQISSPFLSALPFQLPGWRRATVTLQKEVGDVLRAGPGDPEYSPLSFLARLCFEVEQLKELGPGCFWPPPQVDSVLVRIDAGPRPTGTAEALELGRALFRRRRKTLRSALSAVVKELRWSLPEGAEISELLSTAGIEPEARIDRVAPERIRELASAFRSSPS